jgi:hypothetical protein
MRIAICDDEPAFVDHFTEIISCYFKDHSIKCSIQKFYSAQDLLAKCKGLDNFDAIVLDIEMPDFDGIYAAEEIRRRDKDIPIMFLSSNNSHGDSACDFQIFKYIYKSAGKEKIYSAFDALVAKKDREKLSYIVQTYEGAVKTLLKDILYIQVHDHYADLHLCNGMILCERKKIKAFTDDSLFDTFILANRNTFVNYKHINEIADAVILYNGEELKYSKRRSTEIYNKYLYLRRNKI